MKYELRPLSKHSNSTNLSSVSTRWKHFVCLLALLMAGLPAALQACIVTNTPPTVCVGSLPNCKAKIIIKGYSTFGGAPGSQFCSCAFAKVPSILSVDSVEIRSCSSNDGPCSASGPLLPGFNNAGSSSFTTDALASSFFAAASGSSNPWQGFFSAVQTTIPAGVCVDMVFYVTLQNPCSLTTLQNELNSAGPIVGSSSANADGNPNGGHLSISTVPNVTIDPASMQSYTVGLPNGNSLIANQLDHGSNTADVVISNPNGTRDGDAILKWNCNGYTQVFFDSSSPSGFSDSSFSPVPAPTLAPGVGFFYSNFQGASNSVTFTGTPHVPVLPATLPCGCDHLNLLSRQTNGPGTYDNIVGLSPQEGSQEQIWNGTGFTIYTYTSGAWSPTTPPILNVGQAAFFFVPCPSTGPVISSVSPATAQMGDLITINGSGFDPDRPNNCVVVKNGARTIPLRVVSATATQLVVLVGPVPPDATPGQIGVAVGQGAEAGFIDTRDCPLCPPPAIRVPWLGVPGEVGPIPPYDSLQLRPEDALVVPNIGTNGNDGLIVQLPLQGLGWTPLSPVWTFSNPSAGATSSAQITLVPTPQPPATNTTYWFFSRPATNGSVSITISNDCPALTQVQIQGDLAISSQGFDFIFPRLVLTAKLPVSSCAKVICDLIVASYAQRGITINCTNVPVGTNASRLTLTVPGGTISSGGVTICFSPAEAGRPTPVITGVDPVSVTMGDIITITGSGFGNNPDDICAGIMNPGGAIALRALTAQDDRITALVGDVPSNTVPSAIGLVRGIGGPRSIADNLGIIVSPQPAWVFASTQPGTLSAALINSTTPFIVTNQQACPCDGTNRAFRSPNADANRVLTLNLDPNCPPGTKICIETHMPITGTLG